MWIFPLLNKSTIFDTFVKFYAYVVTQFNTKIKVLQSDGGGEFLSTIFKDYLVIIAYYILYPVCIHHNIMV